jgi:hypothetical protein
VSTTVHRLAGGLGAGCKRTVPLPETHVERGVMRQQFHHELGTLPLRELAHPSEGIGQAVDLLRFLVHGVLKKMSAPSIQNFAPKHEMEQSDEFYQENEAFNDGPRSTH